MRILLIVYTAKVLSNSPWSGFSVTLQFNYDFLLIITCSVVNYLLPGE